MALAGLSVRVAAPIASAAPAVAPALAKTPRVELKTPPPPSVAAVPNDTKAAPVAAARPPVRIDDKKLASLKEISASICTGMVMFAKNDYRVCIHATADDSLTRDSLVKYGKDPKEKVYRIHFSLFDDPNSKPTVRTIYEENFRGLHPKANCTMALVHCALDMQTQEVQIKFAVFDIAFSLPSLNQVYDQLCDSFKQRALQRVTLHAKLVADHKALLKSAADLMRSLGPNLPTGFSPDYDPEVVEYNALESDAVRAQKKAEALVYQQVTTIYEQAIPQVLGSIDHISKLMKEEPIKELKLLKGKINRVRKFAEEQGFLLVFCDSEHGTIPGAWDKMTGQGIVKHGTMYAKTKEFLSQLGLQEIHKKKGQIGILIYQMRAPDLTVQLCIA